MGVHHIGISVPDLTAAERFYCDVFGFEEAGRYDINRGPISDKVTGLQDVEAFSSLLKLGNMYIELFQFTSPLPRLQINRPVSDHGYTHIGFQVCESEIDDVFENLQNCGVQWNADLANVDDLPGMRITYGRDPFGNVIEIVCLPKSSELRL